MSHSLGSLSRLGFSAAQRKAINLAPTVAVSPRGTPVARLINLNARGSALDEHGEHHSGDAHGPAAHRADITIPKWSSRINIASSSGLMTSTTPVNGERDTSALRSCTRLKSSCISSQPYSPWTTAAIHLKLFKVNSDSH